MEILTNIDNNRKLVNGLYKLSNLNSTLANINIEKSAAAELWIENELDVNIDTKLTVELEANSSLKLLIIDLNSAQNVENKLTINMQRDSKLDIVFVSLNEQTANSKITVNLNEVGSEANVNVIAIANNRVDNTFNVICNNNAPHTSANIMQRAVALNGGCNVFEATGYIDKMCAKAKNFQESRVLLLDGASKGDASPILLINHHDVEAGHAAGVSRANSDDLYYLMSRGISRSEAEKLITVAFVRPIVDDIIDSQMQELVFTKINEKVN